jgi:predicted DNA-binding transcriptional regulator AlpA
MPQPIKLLGRINAWDKNEILIWLESMRSNKK